MPCKEAMIEKVISVGPDQTVGEALALFEKHKIRTVPVVDANHKLLGLFSFNQLLEALLPISFEEDTDGLRHFKVVEVSLDYLGDSAPWLAHRLNMVIGRKVCDFMKEDIHPVRPDTPLREGIRLIVKHGSPLTVVDNGKLVGIITSQNVAKVVTDIATDMKKNSEEF